MLVLSSLRKIFQQTHTPLNLDSLLNKYLSSPQVIELSSHISSSEAKVHIKGLSGSSSSFVLNAIAQKQSAYHHLFVLDNPEEANYLAESLDLFSIDVHVLSLPSSFKRYRQVGELDNNNIQKRTKVLDFIHRDPKKPLILCSYPEAVVEKVISPKFLSENSFSVKVGDELDLDFIIDFLVEYHFERVDFVYEPGSFSIRGGIVDIFSFANDLPIRIEFFGDEVETIKSFDPETQLSKTKLNQISILPNSEKQDDDQQKMSLFQGLSDRWVIWSTGVAFLKQTIEMYETKWSDSVQNQAFVSSREILDAISKRKVIEISSASFYPISKKIQFHTQPQPVVNKRFDLLADKLESNKNAGFQSYIFSESKKQLERIYAILEDIDRLSDYTPIYKNLPKGFVDNDLKVACYTEHEIFNRFKNPKVRKSYNQDKALSLKELYELKPGDFIVHIDHGVGKFSGLEKIDLQGKTQESVRIIYKGGDLLYVNIHSLHKISRFVGQEGNEPGMHKLGGTAWQKTKEKTKGKVKDIARDLIKLYAARKSKVGFEFSPDGYLQNELEASFIYEDTPDQAKATIAVKADMEKPNPMDRLICGDVGFGKTEIAIRAVFKAAVDGKQAAVLVPTTVLALQHYKSFKERLKEFPVTVDYVNRFKSSKQIKETLAQVKEGKIDILIGTHRLLSKDINFKDLGLLVIDEEQKFGVSAKEKLKALKVNVDTLTLTATPIPRTLQFSLMGARDLSTIATPPPNRLAIDTRINEYNEEVMTEAINYELARDGQVFFVHNRIKDIYYFAEKIEELCGGAKVAVAHGQMDGKKLEEIMVAFVEGHYDVLVSTSIIESGLDISNANTMIVNMAQNFGLSDLYQMRGRVGRSNKKAFCYLFTPPKNTLTDVAKKRLSAIEQHSDLGSGFNIAMRDLDIRGAGNILGAEQSGFIGEMGVEMYQKILTEALTELKDAEFKDLFADSKEQAAPVFKRDCQLDTDLDLLIPDAYVSNINERMNLYRELNEIEEEVHLTTFAENMRDRFGKLPVPTANLLHTLRLKWLGQELGINKILLKMGKMFVYLPSKNNESFYQSEVFGKFLAYLQMHPKRVRLKQKDHAAQLVFDSVSSVNEAIKFLQEIKNFKTGN